MEAKKLPPIDFLMARFEYQPDSGDLFYKLSCGNKKKGQQAGFKSRKGYKKVSINNSHYFVHRLAWLMFYGVEPKETIDHINGDRLDNRISNLRELSHSVNSSLQHEHLRKVCKKRTKYVGVYWNESRRKWQAQYRNKHLGWFESDVEGRIAYLAAKGVK